MGVLKSVTKAVAGSTSLDTMSNLLAQLLVGTLHIKGCAVFFLNPESGELEVIASFGLSSAYLTKGPVSAGRSIAAALNGKPVAVTDIEKDTSLQYPDKAKAEGIRAIVSVPISVSGEVVGVLRLYDGEAWEVSDEDMDSLLVLADNMGLAMSYIRLLNALESVSEIARVALPKP